MRSKRRSRHAGRWVSARMPMRSRRLAGEYGMGSVQRLAEGLSVALGAGGRGAAIGPWIERLRDSIGCEAVDDQAGTSWLASVLVRLAG